MKKLPTHVMILAGGNSSRFEPFAEGQHKATFVVMGKTILAHTIESVLSCPEIKRLTVVCKPQDNEIQTICEKYEDKTEIQIFHQQQALGQADAILAAKEVITEDIIIINAQHINFKDHYQELKQTLQNQAIPETAVILFSQSTKNPEKYGMLGLSGTKVTKLVEKPSKTEGLSDQRVVGLWLLTPAFIEYMSLRPLEEYLLESSLNDYAQENEIHAIKLKTEAVSLKYAWDLFNVTKVLLNQVMETSIDPEAYVASSASIGSKVVIEKGAQIYENSIIEGPCYIGSNAIVGRFSEVGAYTLLEIGAEVQRRVEIKRSIVGANSHIHSGFIGDSIIGSNVKIGAGLIIANRRLDRKDIGVTIKGEKQNSHRHYLGAFIGDNCSIGVRVTINPGRIIPKNSQILPGSFI